MTQSIVDEIYFFLNAFICGVLLMLSYDIIRIFRRIVKHNNVFIAFEDLLYWMGAAIFIFIMFFKENNGVLRVFALVTMILGLLLYLRFISYYFVKYISKEIKLINNFIIKIIKFVFKPIFKLIGILFKKKEE